MFFILSSQVIRFSLVNLPDEYLLSSQTFVNFFLFADISFLDCFVLEAATINASLYPILNCTGIVLPWHPLPALPLKNSRVQVCTQTGRESFHKG